MIELSFELQEFKLYQCTEGCKDVIGLGSRHLCGRHAERSIVLDRFVAGLDSPSLWVERDHLLVSHPLSIRDQEKLPLALVFIDIKLFAYIKGEWQSV